LGHCGCALVGEKKKGNYVYYHCTGNKRKCPEPYAREEVLKACFAELLKGLVFDDEVTVGSSTPCIRATLTRNDSDVMPLLAYRTNKASYRSDSINSMMIGLTDLSNRISLNVRYGSGDRLRSV
jgi:hypothetical protein